MLAGELPAWPRTIKCDKKNKRVSTVAPLMERPGGNLLKKKQKQKTGLPKRALMQDVFRYKTADVSKDHFIEVL